MTLGCMTLQALYAPSGEDLQPNQAQRSFSYLLYVYVPLHAADSGAGADESHFLVK
jgi:hypothetical protein